MKKVLSLPICFFLLFSSLNAQTHNSSLLWKVTGNGLEKPSYIFGSFHMMCKADFEISTILKNKLAETSQFYGELKMDDPDMQQKMAMKMLLPGNNLSSILGDSVFNRLNLTFQQITGMSLQLFNNFIPFMPLSLLVINSISCVDKIQPETEFVTLAKVHKMPIYGLETIEDEIDAINREPLDSQIHSLKQVILNFDSVKNVMQEMKAVYQLRDIDSLYRYMQKNGTGGDFEVNLLINRNKKWMPTISKAMAEMPAFFVVGAGHLGGKEGIISLLQKQGYTLTPEKY